MRPAPAPHVPEKPCAGRLAQTPKPCTPEPYTARLASAGGAGAGAAAPAGRRGLPGRNALPGAAARRPGPYPTGNCRAPAPGAAMLAATPGGSAKPSALVARKSLAGPATGPTRTRFDSAACSSVLWVLIGVTCAQHSLSRKIS